MNLNDKLQFVTNPVTKKLLQTIILKQSNLALSADLTDSKSLLKLVKSVGQHICVLKTHIDIISDFTPDFVYELRELADQYNFLIFEDRKFADIGNTVLNQFKHGIYRISSWADIINAHSLPGEGIVHGLKAGCGDRDIGLLLLAQMSSKGNLFTGEYIANTIKMAEANRDFVIGFIAQENLLPDPAMVTMTPGVKLGAQGDNLGQAYNTPEHVIGKNKSDIIIVGRGIYQADDPEQVALKYKRIAWKAYLQREGLHTDK